MKDIKSSLQDIEKAIEIERIKLNSLIDTKDFFSEETLYQSEKLDALLNHYDKSKMFIVEEQD